MVMVGEDVVVFLLIGGGKLFCFQVFGIIMCCFGYGFILVISFLIVFMEDQVEALVGWGIFVVVVHS